MQLARGIEPPFYRSIIHYFRVKARKGAFPRSRFALVVRKKLPTVAPLP